MMYNRKWINNPDSQQYKQLQHIMLQMDGDFTASEMHYFMCEMWPTKGLESTTVSSFTGKPLMQKMCSFKSSTISKWLRLHPDVKVVNDSISPIVFRRVAV